MENNNSLNDANTQFSLSYELLCLLRWLAEHDADKLKKITSKALASGLKEEISSIDTAEKDMYMFDDIQVSIVDFFNLLEMLLFEAMQEQAVQKALEKDLLPAIDQIDSTVCDDATVRFSIEKATSKIDRCPEENPKDLLFKELLKRWKPSKKNVLN